MRYEKLGEKDGRSIEKWCECDGRSRRKWCGCGGGGSGIIKLIDTVCMYNLILSAAPE